MANTVIAIFENAEQAQAAQIELLANGLSQSQVNIKTATYKSEVPNPEEDEQEDDLIDSVTSFFRTLLGIDHKDVPRYVAVGKHRTIVTVHTETYEEAEVVSSLLDNHGAINVNETSGSYFPESDKVTQHQFSDDALHHAAPKHETDENNKISPRVSGIKSRIIQRSVNKSSFSSEN